MRKIIITRIDYLRVRAVIEKLRKSEYPADDLDAIEKELGRAQIVEPANVPCNVITMNSTVILRDLDSDEIARYKLVYPWEAKPAQGNISVLAPIGTAILGYQLGDLIEWEMPVGKKRYKVEQLLFQPEREGRFDL